jgi:hypothetical protein
MQNRKSTRWLRRHCLRQPFGESGAELDAELVRVGAMTESIDHRGKYAVALQLH